MEPNNDKYFFKRGIANTKLESYGAAIYSFSKAIKLNPQNAEYYYKYGEVLNKINDYAQAKEMYKMANKIEPHKYKTNVHYNSYAEELY